MNILLTTSATPITSPFSTDEKRPPLGLGFLISVLRNAGHEVFFIDNYLHPSDFLETDYLIANQIDCVGIYANTICYRDTVNNVHAVYDPIGYWQVFAVRKFTQSKWLVWSWDSVDRQWSNVEWNIH